MQPISCTTTKEMRSMDVTREITLPLDPQTAWNAVTALELVEA